MERSTREPLTADHIDIGEAVQQNLSWRWNRLLLESVSLDDGAVTYSAGTEDGDPPQIILLRVCRAPGS